MNEKEFGSVYIHKQSGQKIRVKRADAYSVVILFPDGTTRRDTRKILDEEYRFSKKESKQMKFGEFRRS